MAAVYHLGFVMRVFGHPCIWCFLSLQNLVGVHTVVSIMQVLIFFELGLKTPIHAPKIGVLLEKGELGPYLTQCGLAN